MNVHSCGVEVHSEGEGPVLVMIHGGPDTYRLWEPQVAALRDKFTCVRFPLPGFDISRPRRLVTQSQTVACFAAIVDAVSAELVDWLVHSLSK